MRSSTFVFGTPTKEYHSVDATLMKTCAGEGGLRVDVCVCVCVGDGGGCKVCLVRGCFAFLKTTLRAAVLQSL